MTGLSKQGEERLYTIAAWAIENEGISVDALGQVIGAQLTRLGAVINRVLADSKLTNAPTSVVLTGARVQANGVVVLTCDLDDQQPEGGAK